MSLEEKRELVTARKEYKKALKLFPRTAEYQEQVSYIRSALLRLSGAMH
jgi:Flp pilus assembly protein TadD